MKKSIKAFGFAAILAFTQSTQAAIVIAHVENTDAGQFLDSAGLALTTGGVSVGFFSSAPADSAFGTTIITWAGLLLAGYTDVRSFTTSGATLSGGFDWDMPLPIGGSVLTIPIASLPANTQLYAIAFNAGTYNIATPSISFIGATDWAVVKDDANMSPADLGTKTVLLNTAVGAEILRGTDNGINVNLTAIVPEPSCMLLLGFCSLGLLLRRRRTSSCVFVRSVFEKGVDKRSSFSF